MRLREILSESGRNLATGTTRALGFALALLAGLVVTIGMDTAATSTIRIEHHHFRADGATLWSLAHPDGIDAARCEALGALPGVMAAGAIATDDDARLATLPSTGTRVTRVSPGMAKLLGVTASPSVGVWASPRLAEILGIRPGQDVELHNGQRVPVAAVHHLPEAITTSALGSGFAVPAPSTGRWDECWLDIETNPDTATAALHFAVIPGTDDGMGNPPQLSQLNSVRGRTHDLDGLLAARPTRWLLLGAPLLAAAVGIVNVRIRRLEQAAARHIGVTRTDLAAITAIETLAWATAGAIATVAVVGFAHLGLSAGAGLDGRVDLARTILSASPWAAFSAVAAVAGSVAASATTTPDQLYRYFRERA